MNKKLLSVIFLAVIVIAGGIVGFIALGGKEEAKEPTQKVEQPKEQKEVEEIVPEELNYTQKSDEELIQVAKGLIEKFDSLSLAKTEEEYDQIRKDLFVSYDFYAPLSDFTGPDKEVKTTVSNEKLTKGESFFIYEVDWKTDRTLQDGTKSPTEGHASFEIIQDDEGNFKITVIR